MWRICDCICHSRDGLGAGPPCEHCDGELLSALTRKVAFTFAGRRVTLYAYNYMTDGTVLDAFIRRHSINAPSSTPPS